MLLLLFAFIILILAGLYTAELSWRAAGLYISMVLVALGLIGFMGWNKAVWWLFIGFIDAILVIHVFKENIAIRRMR